MISPRLIAPVVACLAALSLAGCAGAPTTPSASSPSESTPADGCTRVTVIVDFGVLDEPPVEACAAAGVATDIFGASGISTEGTVDYGDQVICRVNGEPSAEETVSIEGVEPFVETCQTLNANAYWALWVRNAPNGEWEYAQEGATTLELSDGQSVGLVYTPGTESIPPQG